MTIDAFEAERPRLFGIAYRMLGSVAEAEDVVQDTWLRWNDAASREVVSPRAYLAQIATRLCLDRLRSARARREEYVGPWLPEPVRTSEPDRDSISFAFLLLVERLAPAERAAYVLHEVFSYTHAEVAEILGASETSCRQLLHRARERLAGARRSAASPGAHGRLLAGFLHACATGDLAAFERLLAADVTVTSDGGGKAKAAIRPVTGADRVARFFVGLLSRAAAPMTAEIVELNGAPAIVVRTGGVVEDVVLLETDEDRIREIYIVRNPDKLARFT